MESSKLIEKCLEEDQAPYEERRQEDSYIELDKDERDDFDLGEEAFAPDKEIETVDKTDFNGMWRMILRVRVWKFLRA
ncbi:hypothetical protein HAX54_047331 [Datura stramonium]|uniref:Uncharacterized protein n=1 Tax=Datura stramonium TaxID=4076 RepID=A0ABS8WI68_DATST|nr:hypothetical protein [Datura stramonium]